MSDGNQQITNMHLNLNINLTELPQCPKCDIGRLLPFGDESRTGAIILKGWACSNPECRQNVFLQAGQLIALKVAEARDR